MNRFLRTAPTRRLLAVIAGAGAAAVLCTAIAIAAQGSGPVPRREPLARAIHQGLAAPAPPGLFAEITFTNHLIASSDIQGSDPLLTGGSGRLWISGDRLRLEVQGSNGDAQIVVRGRSFWVYDPAFKTVYEGALPPPRGHRGERASGAQADRLPSLSRIQSWLNRVAGRLSLTGPIPSDVAGQPAYTVRVSPRHDGGLLGAAELTWDASHRVPLEFSVYARSNPSPVLSLAATDISFGRQASTVFSIQPPTGAKVVKLSPAPHRAALRGGRLASARRALRVTGMRAVSSRLSFALDAPASLAGRPRESTRLLELGGHAGAMLRYGRGLGAIIVVEESGAGRHRIQNPPTGDQPGLTLPTVSLPGATAQQLQTALGTLLRFTRHAVTFTVLGSVSGAVADRAARGL